MQIEPFSLFLSLPLYLFCLSHTRSSQSFLDFYLTRSFLSSLSSLSFLTLVYLSCLYLYSHFLHHVSLAIFLYSFLSLISVYCFSHSFLYIVSLLHFVYLFTHLLCFRHIFLYLHIIFSPLSCLTKLHTNI